MDIPLKLDVAFTGNKIEVNAAVDSGDLGHLSLTGLVSVPTWQTWQTSGQVKGVSFLALDTADYQLRASPNLHFSAKPGRVSVGGEIDVPKANIRLRNLPAGSVHISNDVIVFIDKEPPPAVRSIFVADITIKTGDKVYFSGMGLSGRITGDVRFIQRENGLQEVYGDVGIREGEYRALGDLPQEIVEQLTSQQDLLIPLIHQRRARSNETHHLDNPAVGMIVRITAIEELLTEAH